MIFIDIDFNREIFSEKGVVGQIKLKLISGMNEQKWPGTPLRVRLPLCYGISGNRKSSRH
jgi:hypothetical protein